MLGVVPSRGLDDRRDLGLLAALPRQRSVEVDDVDPGRSVRPEPLSDTRRIVRVGLLSIERPLSQTDDPATPKVDCRQDLEAARPSFAVAFARA